MTKSMRSCRTSRQGLTLIEVVAGLALMATILVAMLTLKTRFTQHLASSDRRFARRCGPRILCSMTGGQTPPRSRSTEPAQSRNIPG